MSLSFISTSYSLCPSSVYDHEGRGLGLTCRYGSGLKAATKKDVPGLYYSLNKPMGNSTGLRQYYRYGIYSEFPHSLLPHPTPSRLWRDLRHPSFANRRHTLPASPSYSPPVRLTVDACGYQKGGAGVCNSTIFGYPFEPLNQILADTPKDFKKQTVDVIGEDATAFKDSGYNHAATRAASLLTFVSPLLWSSLRWKRR